MIRGQGVQQLGLVMIWVRVKVIVVVLEDFADFDFFEQ
jgi:hypothetical protein